MTQRLLTVIFSALHFLTGQAVNFPEGKRRSAGPLRKRRQTIIEAPVKLGLLNQLRRVCVPIAGA